MNRDSHQRYILYHVLLILRPLLEDLQREPGMQHAWSGKHDHGAGIVDIGTIERLEVADERERGAHSEKSEGREAFPHCTLMCLKSNIFRWTNVFRIF